MSAVYVRRKPSVGRLDSRMCVQKQRDHTSMASLELCWPAPMRAIGAQNLLTMPGGVSTCGYLHKKGGSQFSLMKWPLRYIILHKGCVYYFKTSTSPCPQGAFSLNGYNRVMRASEETTSSNVFPFKIVHFSKKHRTWLFSAASEEERRRWMRSLRKEIDHYNDQRDSMISFDTESDADSFYGSIEQTMDIKHSEERTDDDYMEEDDDEDDDEDYVKPDSSPPSTVFDSRSVAGRPNVPPPAYPPPPVPAMPRPLTSDPGSRFHRGPSLPPPVPPPNKLSPSAPSQNHPPPFPHLSVLKDSGSNCFAPLDPPPHPPLPKPPNIRRPLQGRGLVLPVQRAPEVWKTPPNIGRLLDNRETQGAGCGKPSLPPPPPVPASSSYSPHPAPPPPAPPPRTAHRPSAPKPPLAGGRPLPPSLPASALKPFAPSRTPTIPSRTPTTTPSRTPTTTPSRTPTTTPSRTPTTTPSRTPTTTPSRTPTTTPSRTPTTTPSRTPTTTPSRTPTTTPSRRPTTTPSRTPTIPSWTPASPIRSPAIPTGIRTPIAGDDMQRVSPDGQSFRTSMDEMQGISRRQPVDDLDEDYVHVQLPDSVFINTTETSSVEKLFRETSSAPHDGLYGIRNSGTKTSKVLVVWDVSLGKARNYRVFEEDQKVFLDTDMTFLSLEALIEHYHSNPLPHHGSLCLQAPYGDQCPG